MKKALAIGGLALALLPASMMAVLAHEGHDHGKGMHGKMMSSKAMKGMHGKTMHGMHGKTMHGQKGASKKSMGGAKPMGGMKM